MALTQELDDACEEIGSKIILTSNVLEEESLPNLSSTSSSNAFSSPQTFLRVGKPGKLFLKPNYTAFTKTNLGSIPSKVEKTLIKTEESIPITITLNKQVQRINLPQEKMIEQNKNSQSGNNNSQIKQIQKHTLNKNNFKFLYVIGKGGFGRVWKIQSKKIQIHVIIEKV